MRILLATDGSECAEVARDLAHSIDWPSGSVIRVATVVEPLDVVFGAPWAGRLAGEVETIGADLERHGEAVLEQAARGLVRDGVELERVILRGRPATALVDDARTANVDLIMLGSRGHGTIVSMLIGSVAKEVTDHAPCPVLVARGRQLTRVVLAHDGSPHARAAEALLSQWPIFGSAAIEVVSVAQQRGPWHLPPSATLYVPSTPDYFEAYREVLREQKAVAEEAAARLRRVGLRANAGVVEGDPAEAILGVAENHQADLILLGTHGRTGVQRLLLGSVARNVMVHAPESVLVVRPAVS
jgi:nucleotide-binding universal stress UspA family protein